MPIFKILSHFRLIDAKCQSYLIIDHNLLDFVYTYSYIEMYKFISVINHLLL